MEYGLNNTKWTKLAVSVRDCLQLVTNSTPWTEKCVVTMISLLGAIGEEESHLVSVD